MAQIITIPSDAIIYDIDIDINRQNDKNTVYTKQYDTGTRYIRATIWNRGTLFPLSSTPIITFACTKPKSGYGIENNAGIDSEGRIIYEITDQTTAESGNFDAEFRIYKTKVVNGVTVSQRETTFDFKMHVAKSALDDKVIISAPEFNVLTNLVNTIGDLVEDATNALSQIATITQDEATRVTNEEARIAKDEKRPYYDRITQAEYNALPDNIKTNPMYEWEITDNPDSDLIDELTILLNATNTAKSAAENVVLQKNGINDATITTIETWSSDKITKRIRTTSYTASSTVSTIPHNLNFVSTTDDLLVLTSGVLLEEGDNYTHSSDFKSIILNGWTIGNGEKVFFKLYKNVK